MVFEKKEASTIIRLVFLLFIIQIIIPSCNLNLPQPNHLRITVIEDGKEVFKDIERIKLDSLNQNQLEQVNKTLSTISSPFPNTKDFIYIKYYPGKDKCNSTGSITRHEIGERDLYFRSEIQNRENVTAAWFYKNDEGLKRYNKEVTYHFDKDHIIENTFFEYHYPCSSYAILHKSGKYFAFFGESYYLQHIKDIDSFMESIQTKN